MGRRYLPGKAFDAALRIPYKAWKRTVVGDTGGMREKDPQYVGHRRRLRERFEKSGLEGFADYEVVELLLTLAIPRSDVKQPAKELIACFGNLRGILDAPLSELRTVRGLGDVAPVALRIIRAAADLYLQQRAEQRESLKEGTKERDL